MAQQEYSKAELKEEAIKSLDHFQNELQMYSERFQKNINRLENVAIRFRGHEPKADDNKKDETKPAHKIEELSRMTIKLNQQLNSLDYLIGNLERI